VSVERLSVLFALCVHLVTADDELYIRHVSESSHGCIFNPLKPKRQRGGKDR
jgi:hypothetical protein